MNVLLFLPSNPLAKADPLLSTVNWFGCEGLILTKNKPITHTITIYNKGFSFTSLVDIMRSRADLILVSSHVPT